MIDETLKRIERRIETTEALPADQKSELTTLLDTLKTELTSLDADRAEHLASITGFVDLSTHEAMRREPDPRLFRHALDGLSDSVDAFQASHPKLAQTVNAIGNLLAGMGI